MVPARAFAAADGQSGTPLVKVGVVMTAATPLGGAEVMLLHLLRYGHGHGVEYHLAFLEAGPMVAMTQTLGWRAGVFPAGHLREVHRYARAVLGLARWVGREAFDVVLSWMPKGHLYAAPAAALAGRANRLAWFQHGKPTFPPRSRVERLTMRLPAREVWCPSRHSADAQRRCTPGKSVRVVYPSVDLRAFESASLPSAAEARARLGLPADAAIVGMVARLERWKGCHTFVEAAGEIARRHPGARFFIVGGEHFSAPGYRAELRSRADALGLGDRLLIPGHRGDAPIWIQAADVLVSASREEPFGMVVLEGLALGKAVVASASGGPLEVIRDGRNGRLFPLGDAAALADIVCALLADGERRDALGREGRRTCPRFSAARMADEVAGALRALAAEHPKAPRASAPQPRARAGRRGAN